MISHTKRFIFIHIPKTAGTSVEEALSECGVCLQGRQNYDSIYFKHAFAADVSRMLGDEFHRYYRFTVVRNPWDWAVSNYLFNRGLHRPWTRHTSYRVSASVPPWAADWSFASWLRWWLETCSPQQSRMLTDAGGTLLVNRILRFEWLADEFPALCENLSIAPRPLPHAMASPRRSAVTPFYDRDARALVAEGFREDIERFGYHFDGGCPHVRAASCS